MSSPVYIPLKPGTKQPAVSGWTAPDYVGITPDTYNGPVGLRCDGLVVVDCDSEEAALSWRQTGATHATKVVKTPRGYHFYYEATEGSPTGPAVGVLPGIDIRAGSGAYVVVSTPDLAYSVVTPNLPAAFNPSWLPAPVALVGTAEGWDQIPEGRRNTTLTAFAGTLRKQGANEQSIYSTLAAINRAFCDPPLDGQELWTITKSVCRYSPDPDVEVVVVDDEQTEVPRYLDARKLVIPPAPEWLWRPFLPQGRLVMLDGQEGIGKGMLCVYLAVCSTSGRAIAEGAPNLEPRPVLWYTAEDDPEEDILRRLAAAGYDPETAAPIIFWNPRTKRPRSPERVDEFMHVIKVYRPRFVFFDPGRSFIAPPEEMRGETGFNNEAAVRPGLESLMRLAYDTATTVLFVHHWNKRSDGTTRDKTAGTVAFQQVVRHKITLAEVGTLRALSVEKSNMIDKLHTVWGYDIAERPEMESAYFVLGQHMPEYQDLDEWINVAKKLSDEGGAIELIVDWRDAAIHYGSYLQPGDVAPTRGQISTDLAVSVDTAKQIRGALRDIGVIVGSKNGPGKWGDVPPEIARAINTVRDSAYAHRD